MADKVKKPNGAPKSPPKDKPNEGKAAVQPKKPTTPPKVEPPPPPPTEQRENNS